MKKMEPNLNSIIGRGLAAKKARQAKILAYPYKASSALDEQMTIFPPEYALCGNIA
jgi:hypothetical protein